VTAVMFVDAALPHPGCSWRESVPTGLAEPIGSGIDKPTLAAAVEPCCLGSGAVASGVALHVAVKMA
jgi:hypothetical protein